MGNLVDITKTIKIKRSLENQEKLDKIASYVAINKCLQYLKMNKLPETKELKKLMYKTLKKLQPNG